MAGAMRQPIDVPALERYINQNVPAIVTPLTVKQVGENYAAQYVGVLLRPDTHVHVLTSFTLSIVWFRPIEPYLSNHSIRWPKVRITEKTTGKTTFKNSA